MKLSSKLLAGLSLSALFIGCGPDMTETELSNSDIQNTGSIQFIAKDSETGDLLDSVKIENIINGENSVIYTDSLGESNVSGLINGDYQFLVSKSGYATMWQDVSMNIENNLSDVPMIYDIVSDIDLYELGAEVTGKVYYVDTDGNKQIAKDAKVELTVSSSFKQRLYETTVDAKGVYTFSNLPENVNYTIKVLKYTDANGAVYNASSKTKSGVKAGETETITSFSVSLDAKPFEVIQDNLDNIKATDAIIVSFSEPIDEDKIELGDIRVSTGGTVAATVEISTDKKTVTITPVSGSWKISSNHSVYVDVTSTEGEVVNYSSSFTIKSDGSLGDVVFYQYIASGDTNSINSTDGSATLYWAKLANADAYEIYVKDYQDSAFVYSKIVTSTDDTISTSLSVTNLLDEGHNVQFMIVGINDKNRSDFATAKIDTLRDDQVAEVSTNITSTTTVNGKDLAGKVAETVGTYNFTFDDNMNTAILATVSLNSTISPFFTYEQEWLSSTQLRVKLIAKAGEDSSLINGKLTIDLSKLTDEAGNNVNSADDNYTVDVNPVP